VDKPAGPTSHDVVDAVRRALGMRRVGHAGTLDPPATGLLVVLTGRATRLTRFVAMLPKRYAGTVQFGWETSTDDAAGTPTSPPDASWRDADPARLRAALEEIAAQAVQVPPAVSAKQQDGERAYRKARRGETVSLAAVPVRIDRIDMGAWDAEAGALDIEVTCGAGTYIRAIARDLGRAVGSRAHLSRLRRVAIGEWTVAAALPLDRVAPAEVGVALRPLAEAVAHLPRLALTPEDARRFRFGQKLSAPPAPLVAVFEGDALLGVGEDRDGALCAAVGLAS